MTVRIGWAVAKADSTIKSKLHIARWARCNSSTKSRRNLRENPKNEDVYLWCNQTESVYMNLTNVQSLAPLNSLQRQKMQPINSSEVVVGPTRFDRRRLCDRKNPYAYTNIVCPIIYVCQHINESTYIRISTYQSGQHSRKPWKEMPTPEGRQMKIAR